MRALATLLVVLVVAGGLIVGQAKPAAALSNYDQAYWHDAGTNGTLRRDWMASLQDGLPLSALTIPGTHDSGSYEGDLKPQVCNQFPYSCGDDASSVVKDWGITQTMTFTEQLDAGIRAFDLRLGQMSGGSVCDDSSGKLWVVHAERICTKRTVDDAFTAIQSFLGQHSSESVVMRIKNDTQQDANDNIPSDATFDQLLREAIARFPGLFWQVGATTNPRLGDIRGKVVILQNWKSSGPEVGISYDENVQAIADSYSWNQTTDMAKKWRGVQSAFETANNGDITKQHITYTSAVASDSAAIFFQLLNHPAPTPYFFASGKSYSGTYDSPAPTPWTPLSCGPASDCLSRDPGGFYYDNGWVYYKGMNHMTMEFVNNTNAGRLGIVYADFPNPGKPTGDYYDQQGLIGMLIATNDKVNARVKPTTTHLVTGSTVPLGGDSWFLAGVEPNPGEAKGTIGFTSNGSPIAGCEAIPIRADGSVSCKFTGSVLGSYSIVATYKPGATSASGVSIGLGSQSPTNVVQVTNTPVGVPNSPDSVQAVPGNGTIKADWQPPADSGLSPVASYTATALPDGASCTAIGSTSCVLAVSDVTKSYNVTVRATNAQGTGPPSVASPSVSFPPVVSTHTTFTGAGIADPQAITLGPDGAMWFVNANGTVGRISPVGAVSTFSSPSSSAKKIVAGPDGALWYTSKGDNTIRRITTAGITSTFTDATNIVAPQGLTVGPDGALWFTNQGGNSIGRITTGGAITRFTNASIDQPWSITTGPDGALWFTNAGNNTIGRITTAGVVTSFGTGGVLTPYDITRGPDGALWFTGGGGKIGRITTTGSVTSVSGTTAASIVAGPDGALWFTNGGLETGRITTAGVKTSYPTDLGVPTGIAAGPDGNLWVSAGTGSASTIGTVWAGRLPGAPAKPTTLRGNQKVTVSWAPPPADPVFVAAYAPTSYQVTTFQGGVAQAATCTAAAPATSCDVTGLSNGTSYTFSVTATNVIGTGPASVVSDAVAPSGAPAAPPQPTVLKGNRSVTVAWDPPADPGASPVSAYAVIGYQLIPGPGQVWTPLGPLCAWTSGPRSCDVKNLSPNVQYKFVVVAQNGQGTSAPSPESEVVSPYLAPPVSLFHPLAVPTRILDSRPPPEQVGPYSTPWGPGTVRDVQVAGAGGVPANASSVTLNVTVTGTTAASFLTVWPKGADQPTASNLNWVAGQTIPNAVTVTVGAEGKVSVFNPSGNTNVIVDVVGYYDDSGSGDGFTSLVPVRVQDSRPPPEQVGPYSTPWGPGTDRSVQVAGTGGVPADADAVVANVTVTGTTAESFLTVYPEGAAKPTASSLNWRAGQTIPNAVTIKVGTGGKIRIFNNSGNANVLVDVVGYFKAGTGDSFHPTAPLRIQDSRPAPDTAGAYATPWNAGTSRTVAVPAGMKSVLANVTVTGATAESFVTTWNTGADRPTASSLNFKAGVTIANSVTTKIGPDGSFSAFNNSGNVHVIVDVAGWYG